MQVNGCLVLLLALAARAEPTADASADASADPAFPSPFKIAVVNQGCPPPTPLPRLKKLTQHSSRQKSRNLSIYREACLGRSSVCWSPGVRDTDCPGHGLCCTDGCHVNVCLGATPLPPPPR